MLPRNRLLAALPEPDFQRLLLSLQPVPLRRKQVLHTPNLPIRHVYFVEEGAISVVTDTNGSGKAEAWLIGNEGIAGVPVVLGAETTLHTWMVQVEGSALQMTAADLRQHMDEMPSCRAVLLHYVYSVLIQTSQSGACNIMHRIRQRLARWLLMVHDRLERDDLPLIQEDIAQMLGVRRASVGEEIEKLEGTGAIRHGRGHIRVLDRSKLEALACECYFTIRPATYPLSAVAPWGCNPLRTDGCHVLREFRGGQPVSDGRVLKDEDLSFWSLLKCTS